MSRSKHQKKQKPAFYDDLAKAYEEMFRNFVTQKDAPIDPIGCEHHDCACGRIVCVCDPE